MDPSNPQGVANKAENLDDKGKRKKSFTGATCSYRCLVMDSDRHHFPQTWEKNYIPDVEVLGASEGIYIRFLVESFSYRRGEKICCACIPANQ